MVTKTLSDKEFKHMYWREDVQEFIEEFKTQMRNITSIDIGYREIMFEKINELAGDKFT